MTTMLRWMVHSSKISVRPSYGRLARFAKRYIALVCCRAVVVIIAIAMESCLNYNFHCIRSTRLAAFLPCLAYSIAACNASVCCRTNCTLPPCFKSEAKHAGRAHSVWGDARVGDGMRLPRQQQAYDIAVVVNSTGKHTFSSQPSSF